MLTPGYLKTCGDDLVRLYQQLEDDIVRDAARRIVKMDFSVTDAARWQIERLQQSGAVYEDMIKSLSKYTGKSEREIKSCYNPHLCSHWYMMTPYTKKPGFFLLLFPAHLCLCST